MYGLETKRRGLGTEGPMGPKRLPTWQEGQRHVSSGSGSGQCGLLPGHDDDTGLNPVGIDGAGLWLGHVTRPNNAKKWPNVTVETGPSKTCRLSAGGRGKIKVGGFK